MLASLVVPELVHTHVCKDSRILQAALDIEATLLFTSPTLR